MLTRRNFLINGIKALAGVVVAGVAVKSIGVEEIVPLGTDDDEIITIYDDGTLRGPSSVCPSEQLHIVDTGNHSMGVTPPNTRLVMREKRPWTLHEYNLWADKVRKL